MKIHHLLSFFLLTLILKTYVVSLPITFQRLIRENTDNTFDYVDLVGDLHVPNPEEIKQKLSDNHNQSLNKFNATMVQLSRLCKLIIEHRESITTGNFLDAFGKLFKDPKKYLNRELPNLTTHCIDSRLEKYIIFFTLLSTPYQDIVNLTNHARCHFLNETLDVFFIELHKKAKECRPWLDYIDESDIRELFVIQDALHLGSIQEEFELEVQNLMDYIASNKMLRPDMTVLNLLYKSSDLLVLYNKFSTTYIQKYFDLELLLEICGSKEKHRIVYGGYIHTANIAKKLTKLGYISVYTVNEDRQTWTKSQEQEYLANPWVLSIDTWDILDQIPC